MFPVQICYAASIQGQGLSVESFYWRLVTVKCRVKRRWKSHSRIFVSQINFNRISVCLHHTRISKYHHPDTEKNDAICTLWPESQFCTCFSPSETVLSPPPPSMSSWPLQYIMSENTSSRSQRKKVEGENWAGVIYTALSQLFRRVNLESGKKFSSREEEKEASSVRQPWKKLQQLEARIWD